MSSVFFRLYQRLLPRSRGWSIVLDKYLRKFFEGLTVFQEDYKLYTDSIFNDIDPYQTRELSRWEKQFQLSGSGTEADRRQALDAAWKAQGGQSPGYLQKILRDAGFDVFLHEWWYYDGLVRKTRNPLLYVDDGTFLPSAVFGEPEAVFGEPEAIFGEKSSGGGYLLVNKGPGISYLEPTAAACFGELDAVFGEPDAVFGENLGKVRFIPKEYQVPVDPPLFPYFCYVGGEIFPDFASVEAERKTELERMILKYFPDQLWIVMLINYV